MPIFTRSLYNKLKEDIQQDHISTTQKEGKDSDPLYSVSKNPLFEDNMTKGEKNLFISDKDMRKAPEDSEDEKEENQLKEVKQDPKFLRAIEKIIACDKQKYFLFLVDQGAKLPHDFDTKNIKSNPDETPLFGLSALTQYVKTLEGKIKVLEGGATTKTYALDDICPYPFDRRLNMILFPKHCEIPILIVIMENRIALTILETFKT